MEPWSGVVSFADGLGKAKVSHGQRQKRVSPVTLSSAWDRVNCALIPAWAADRLATIPQFFCQDLPLKTYRPTRVLLTQIEELLAKNKPSFGRSPLDRVLELLSEGRHYSWAGIYVAVADNQQLLGSRGDAGLQATSMPHTRSKMLVSMKIGSREVGVLAAESERDFPFGAEDRVLLEKVAEVLARFLAGRGKYLVREAREKAASQSVPPRRPQSASSHRFSAAAVGDK